MPRIWGIERIDREQVARSHPSPSVQVRVHCYAVRSRQPGVQRLPTARRGGVKAPTCRARMREKRPGSTVKARRARRRSQGDRSMASSTTRVTILGVQKPRPGFPFASSTAALRLPSKRRSGRAETVRFLVGKDVHDLPRAVKPLHAVPEVRVEEIAVSLQEELTELAVEPDEGQKLLREH